MPFEVDFAILASLPEATLESARDVAERTGFAALQFNDNTGFFTRVEEMRDDHPVPVLFYASQKQQMEGETLHVSWLGEYVGYADAEDDGAHPEGDAHLATPEQAHTEGDDEEDETRVPRYWHVKDLRELPQDERIPIASLESNMQRGIYRRNTEPRRPALVALPSGLEREGAA